MNGQIQQRAFSENFKNQIEDNKTNIVDIKDVTDYFQNTNTDFVLNTQFADFRIESPSVVIGTTLFPSEIVLNGGVQKKPFRNADYDQIVNNAGNINSNELNILALQLITQYMTHQTNLT